MYDPKYGLLHAYRVLFAQWRLAFEIGKENRRRGAVTLTLRHLIGLWRRRKA